MAISKSSMVLLNGAIGLIVAGSAALMLRSTFIGNAAVPCPERYVSALQWSLARDNGELLSAQDLQARVGGTDWGLMDRARIVKVSGAPDEAALEIDLLAKRQGAAADAASDRARQGAGFHWTPASMDAPTAACLSYSVRVAPDFELSMGGRLPGLTGGRPTDASEQPDTFAAQLSWADDGMLDAFGRVPVSASPKRLAREPSGVFLTAGAWQRVDQEVVLNQPGRSDGVLRIWIDGRLVLERTDLMLRSGAEAAIRGVLAEVAYGRTPASGKSGVIALTPFVLRW